MSEKKPIMDITGLSAALAEALKELSTGGKSLTLANLNRTLAKRKEITALLERANGREESVSENELASLKLLLESGENKRREMIHQMTAMEVDLNRERDFYKRLSLTLVNLARIPENEAFHAGLDECTAVLQNGADMERLEACTKKLRDRMLKEDVGGARKRPERAEEDSRGVGKVRSFFARGEKPAPVDDVFPRIKDELSVALDELQRILGEDFRASVHLAKEHVGKSRDLDSLVAQKTFILSVVDGYVQRATREKDQVTTFLKELSERLLEMEKEMAASASSSQDVHLAGDGFSESLESEIRVFRESVLVSPDFESLRTFVVSQLTKMTTTLQKRRQEYTVRIEKVQQESEDLKKNFRSLIGRVIDKNKTLQEEIQRDPLTEIFNRRTYEASIAAELERFKRYKKPFSILFLDIDHFKQVNDRYGHDAGDRVLRAIARKVREILRKPDVFARYGGEEFVIILPETTLENGVGVAQKIRDLVADTVFEYEGERVPVTVSLGVTEVEPGDLEAAHITQRADRHLYRAKAGGRNRVISDLDGR